MQFIKTVEVLPVPENETKTMTRSAWYPIEASQILVYLLLEQTENTEEGVITSRSMGIDMNILVTQTRKVQVQGQKIVKVKRPGHMEKGKQVVEDFALLEEVVQESVPASFPIPEESIDSVVSFLNTNTVNIDLPTTTKNAKTTKNKQS